MIEDDLSTRLSENPQKEKYSPCCEQEREEGKHLKKKSLRQIQLSEKRMDDIHECEVVPCRALAIEQVVFVF